jgi:hypothetical protein
MPVVITGNNTPTAGGITYGDGSTYANTAAGTSGQLLQSNGASAPTWATVSAGFTLGTPVATTSGTSIDFTGIPAGVKQIVVSFKNVSTSSTSQKLIQIGDSGGIENTGYSSRSTSIITPSTIAGTGTASGFLIYSILASTELSGSITLTLQNATTFTFESTGIFSDYNEGAQFFTSGGKSLSATLDRVRITTVNGTDTFDGGEINIAYI